MTGSAARTYLFGDYRTTPTDTISDRSYTGHADNNSGGNDLGLIYMNARYYVPGIGRFASADSIVPRPQDPQSFNRFAYVRNNPLNRVDPTGHRDTDGCDAGECVDPDADNWVENAIAYWTENESIYDPSRSETIEIPVVIDGQLVGTVYIPPVDSPQSRVSKNTVRYKAGRGLAALGVGLDIAEMILSVEPGAGIVPSWFDAGATYLSGALTGDNYGAWAAPPGDLPPMVSVNQDLAVNFAEIFVPQVIGGGAIAIGVAAGVVSPVPGDELIYGGVGVMIYSVTDAITSGASAFYDAGRYRGEFHNHFTVGYSSEYGIIVVIWPDS